MRDRLTEIIGRYGWRTPLVVFLLGCQRMAGPRQTLLINWLKLTTSGRKGRGIYCGRGVSCTIGSRLTIHDHVFIGARCFFEISINPQATVSIGSSSWVSHDCHIASRKSVSIGEQVLIGEFVSIRDSTHCYADTEVPIKIQKDIIGFISIEDDVWIGRGCLIQGKPEGIVIGRGAIIAANSVVSRSIPAMEIWGGVPAHFIKKR